MFYVRDVRFAMCVQRNVNYYRGLCRSQNVHSPTLSYTPHMCAFHCFTAECHAGPWCPWMSRCILRNNAGHRHAEQMCRVCVCVRARKLGQGHQSVCALSSGTVCGNPTQNGIYVCSSHGTHLPVCVCWKEGETKTMRTRAKDTNVDGHRSASVIIVS